jgi:hypothetical protein
MMGAQIRAGLFTDQQASFRCFRHQVLLRR